MNTIEKSGKTVEDAVEAGLAELRLASSDVDIEVIEYGSPGIFGMFGKLARVKLTVKKHDDDFDFEMPTLSLDRAASAKQAKPAKPRVEQKPRTDAEKPQVQQKAQPAPVQKVERPAAENVEPQKPKQEKPKAEKPLVEQAAKQPEANVRPRPAAERGEVKRERPPKIRTPRPERKVEKEQKPAGEKAEPRKPMEMLTMEDLPPVEPDKLSEDGKRAYEFLLNTTKLMGVDVEIRLREKEEQMQIQMIGDTLGVLIGRRGETLDALQYLTSLRVNKGREEYLRITLDTEHYRVKREEALRRLAERMANRARKTGRRVALEPMNPYERRVLHSALQDNEFVSTHSEGEDPYRRVIITLK